MTEEEKMKFWGELVEPIVALLGGLTIRGEFKLVEVVQSVVAKAEEAYEAGRAAENEACEQHLRDFSQTRMVPVNDTWRMGLIAGANAIRARREQ